MPKVLQAILLIILLLAGGGAAGAQDGSLTVDEYLQSLREGLAAAQRSDEIGLREIAPRISPSVRVVVEPDRVVTADNQWLTTALDSNSVNMRVIEQRLVTMIELLTQTRTANPDDQARLADIINNPPYKEPEIEPAAPWTPNFSISGELIQNCLIFIGVLIVGSIVIYMLYIVGSSSRGLVRIKRRIDDDVESLLVTSEEAIVRADAVADQGDFRKGMRFLYLSTMIWLEERGMLRYDRTMTNREVLQAIPTTLPLHQRLAPVVQTFDRVWYGYKPIDQDDFDQFRAQVTALREGH